MKQIILAAVFCTAALSLSACGESTSSGSDKNPTNQSSFQDSTFLRQIAQNLIIPSYLHYDKALVSLEQSLTWSTEPDSLKLEDARKAYLNANLAWQAVMPFEFGPAMEAQLSAHSNLFPIDTAKIEANVSAGATNLNSYLFYLSKGFGALDYLLFAPGAQDSLKNSKRRDYLVQIVKDLRMQHAPVLSAWQGDFGAQFPAKLGTAMDGSMSRLFNQFSFEFEAVRRFKIGYPLGVLSLTAANPKEAEARFSGYSDTLLFVSISVLRNLYLGKSGDSAYLGFSDKLKALGKNELDSAIRNRWADIDTKLAAYKVQKMPVHTAVVQDPTALKAIFDAMQSLITYHKVDLASALSLTINYQDNDGD